MKPNHIYIFGDSVAQGIYLDEEGKYRISRHGCIRLLKRAGYPIMNYAVHGYTILQGMADFNKARLEPGSICVIEFGGNDCDLDWDAVSSDPAHFHDGKVPIAQFKKELMHFISAAREKALEPILVTPLPLMSKRYYAWVSKGRNAKNILDYLCRDPESISRWQERYALAVRDAACKANCRLADLRNWLLDEMDYPHLMSMDGIHPNETGHSFIADAAQKHFPLCEIGA